MGESIHITVVAENRAGRAGLLGEHGLALWIEAAGRRILFDTGQGLILRHNAEKLGIDLGTADDLVLSHGHYDHTGGLPHILKDLARTRVFVHPVAFGTKYAAGSNGENRFIGSPISKLEQVREHAATLIETAGPTELAPDIWVTGTIPRHTTFEDTGGPFFTDKTCTQPDPLFDDQALVLQSHGKVVLVLGCAHSGIVNTLAYVTELTGTDRVHAILGGMHLANASAERLQRSLEAIERCGCRILAPCHCTGLAATAAMMTRWPDRVVPIATGSCITI